MLRRRTATILLTARAPVIAVATLAGWMLAGNVAITVASRAARWCTSREELELPGTGNARVVADGVLRGNAPTAEGYRSLARAGVLTVVDLRAERDVVVDERLLTELGMSRTHLPVRDGQPPSPATAIRFLQAVRSSPGPVYVHCGAGVGRTGSATATYQVHGLGHGRWRALCDLLEVGPPSLEQIAYVLCLDADGPIRRPPQLVSAVSRLWDAPRRIRSRLVASRGG